MNLSPTDLKHAGPIKTIIEKDEKIIEALFKTYYGPLCRLINRLVNDKEATKDIVQDAFLKIWKKKEALNEEKSIKSYLYKAAINTAYNFIEKNKRFEAFDEAYIHPSVISSRHTEEQLDASELSEKINEALEMLPPRCKAVFVLSRYENMSYNEIAEALQISPKTVENQMSKALELLRTYLQNYLTCFLVYIIFEKYFHFA